jgi:signal transduction histidine kinase/ligand-binding sensor domain-containing protein
MMQSSSQIRFPGFIFLLFLSLNLWSQQIKFDKVLDGSLSGQSFIKVVDVSLSEQGFIKGIAQDKEGYIWLSSRHGLYRYDGWHFKSYFNNSGDKDSLAKNKISAMLMDTAGIIWFGTWDQGLCKFDPVSNSFTYYQHDPHDSASLQNNAINCLFVDHLDNLWIGTPHGLDELNIASGRFRHFVNKKNNPSSISNNEINIIQEDKQGMIWVGCGFIGFDRDPNSPDGGLNRLDPRTGKFTRYIHIPGDSSSLINNNVTAIFEDSKENLWIGTAANGLHIMNRATGKFTHYLYDSAHPDRLSPPPLLSGYLSVWNAISLITESRSGAIWIGTVLQGINRYDPLSGKISHFGALVLRTSPEYLLEDTVSGFREPVNNGVVNAFTSKEGVLWFGTVDGNLYKVEEPHANIPYLNLQAGANSFYQENDSILWIGTSIKGLDRRNILTGKDRWITNKKGEPNIPPDHDIVGLRPDAHGNLWIGTFAGLYRLVLKTGSFTRFQHDPGNTHSIASDSVQSLYIDKDDLWIGYYKHGLDKMNIVDETIRHYGYDKIDSNSLSKLAVNAITKDKAGDIWVATTRGVARLHQASNQVDHYLRESEAISICADASGMLWAGTTLGFYYFDSTKNEFAEYLNPNAPVKISNVLHILEDNDHNLWLTTPDALIKLDRQRNALNMFGKGFGIHFNNYYDCDNYKLNNGQLLFGDQNGYYVVNPSSIQVNQVLHLNFTSFKTGDEEIQAGQHEVLDHAIWMAKEIRLNHTQNVFSFDFRATDYTQAGDLRYLFLMENYDNAWHDIGTDHQAYFFNVPPGHYIFHVKAINPDGVWAEKTIAIIISPPWWRTWWAVTIFVLLFVGAVWAFIHYRSLALKKENRILEEKINHRTAQLKSSLEDLRSTQSQLIQSEKMASLGELTAGIAHEIQNPLNFVNNFSEVSNELLDEMTSELNKGDIAEAKAIAGDIKLNLEKINHHGKRADAIVKGMLQHSRASSGTKELSDLNALADEYLRLAYHGLRAKDKAFNARMETGFDLSVGKINIIPQDIGRVLLNLYNNAFYAITQKQKQEGEGYEPLVTVTTKKLAGKVLLTVRDNGNGIPPQAVDKIFQPFFTTKPAGQGTGLGLSLSYDIIKAHGGEISLDTTENSGTEFRILLPAG